MVIHKDFHKAVTALSLGGTQTEFIPLARRICALYVRDRNGGLEAEPTQESEAHGATGQP